MDRVAVFHQPINSIKKSNLKQLQFPKRKVCDSNALKLSDRPEEGCKQAKHYRKGSNYCYTISVLAEQRG